MSENLEFLRNSECTGKHRHETFLAAQRQMQIGKRTNRTKINQKLNVYQCRFCHGYHIGHGMLGFYHHQLDRHLPLAPKQPAYPHAIKASNNRSAIDCCQCIYHATRIPPARYRPEGHQRRLGTRLGLSAYVQYDGRSKPAEGASGYVWGWFELVRHTVSGAPCW